jgi:hypothetical protein
MTVPTGDRLVWNVLHDPPGGLSSATWAENAEMTVSISMSGMRANNAGGGKTHSFNAGLESDLKNVVAPFGIGIDKEMVAISAEVTYWQENPGNTPTASADKSSDSGYDITFSLEKAISTSAEPSSAGRASDIILGGGLELMFTEVVYVNQDASYSDRCCMKGVKDVAWEPSKLTTFVLPVERIMNGIIRLKAQKDQMLQNAGDAAIVTQLTEGDSRHTDDEEKRQEMNTTAYYLDKKIKDWETILQVYHESPDPAAMQKKAETKVIGKLRTIADSVKSINAVQDRASKIAEVDADKEYNKDGGIYHDGGDDALGNGAAGSKYEPGTMLWERLGANDHGPDDVYDWKTDGAGAPANPEVFGGIKTGNVWANGNKDALAAMVLKVTAGDMLIASNQYNGLKTVCNDGTSTCFCLSFSPASSLHAVLRR